MVPNECLVLVGKGDGGGCAVPPANPSKLGTTPGRYVRTSPRSPPLPVIRGSLSGGVPPKMSSRATGDFPSGNDPVKPTFLVTGDSPSGNVPVKPTALAIDDLLLIGAPETIWPFGEGRRPQNAVLPAAGWRCGS